MMASAGFSSKCPREELARLAQRGKTPDIASLASGYVLSRTGTTGGISTRHPAHPDYPWAAQITHLLSPFFYMMDPISCDAACAAPSFKGELRSPCTNPVNPGRFYGTGLTQAG